MPRSIAFALIFAMQVGVRRQSVNYAAAPRSSTAGFLTYNLKNPSSQVHKWPLNIEAEIRAAGDSSPDSLLNRR